MSIRQILKRLLPRLKASPCGQESWDRVRLTLCAIIITLVYLPVLAYGQIEGTQPEILVSTNEFGSWQILAINPVTGEFRNVSNYPDADN